MRKILLGLGMLILGMQTDAQVLFSYGTQQVTSKEFLKAFEKNNTPSPNREKDIRDYLDLFVRFKLKVRGGYDLGLDTILAKQPEMQDFRNQIESPFLKDNEMLHQLAEEAYDHSLKDIRISHIFIPFNSSFLDPSQGTAPIRPEDTLAAFKKINEAYSALQSGKDFKSVALKYSADPSVKKNNGDIGYITVFTVSYGIEKLVYALPLNGISAIYRSGSGYHIFQKTDERKAVGKRKVAQILIALDRAGGESQRKIATDMVDSAMAMIKRGVNFEDIARSISMDRTTSYSGGVLPPVNIGSFDPEFENQVFGLKKDGDISSPFETEQGFHIVKRIEEIPVEQDKSKAMPEILREVSADKRSYLAELSFRKKALVKTGLKELPFNKQQLWKYTDTFLIREKKLNTDKFNENTALFQFPGKSVRVSDWIAYVQKMNPDHNASAYLELWEQFKGETSVDQYRNNLSKYEPDFKTQFDEFMEGNILFEAMERKVWGPSSKDEKALNELFIKNKAKYVWQNSGEIIFFNIYDSILANAVREHYIKHPEDWRHIMEDTKGKVFADSTRMELSQISANTSDLKEGMITPLQVNDDRTASFYHIIKLHKPNETRSFEDARGMVVNDLQVVMEEKWINELKKKYPVKMNQSVLTNLISTAK